MWNTFLELWKSWDAAGTEDSYVMKPVDQRARTKGCHDIMTRRLKNRERQRRYRERKRLEAEKKKSSVVEKTTPVQVELLPNGVYSNCMKRIYCKRDWKKDARRAHAIMDHEATANGSLSPPSVLSSETQASSSASGNKAEPSLEREFQSLSASNGEAPRVVLGQRDWKAEARKKKN
ncbi:FAM50A-like protein [Quillaja saponaria]|uniref:FAM50A-like protein n=1 Tax=Quillaja saponaria TaxID=32244 RepID=A0AAD7PFY2_QUISA|nr:FAM50A-like protein [Quillaja saponaria]